MSSPALGALAVAQLVAQGITDVVLAPGSRSGPLAVAAHAAGHRQEIRLHVRIDERSAGFWALGLARVQERPVAVITTSGTAVGNLLPAVMEAHHSGVPLLIVSADRPASLVGTGANQTSHQAGIFATFVRESVRVSSADPPAAWGALVARAAIGAAGTRTGDPGPAHLNVELADPLLGEVSGEVRAVPVSAARRGRAAPFPLAPGPRTVVIAGDASPVVGLEAAAFAEVAGLPLIAEPSSNARTGPAALACGRLLLDTALGARIERVVVFGHPTLSRPVMRLLGRPDVEVIAVTDRPHWVDPTWNVTTVVEGITMGGDLLEPPIDGRLPVPAGPVATDPGSGRAGPADAAVGTWLAKWRTADERLAGIVAERYGVADSGWRLAATVLAALGPADALVVGPSQLVRDLDLCPIPDAPPVVYANRGLAGIDGIVSTAAGVALGRDGNVEHDEPTGAGLRAPARDPHGRVAPPDVRDQAVKRGPHDGSDARDSHDDRDPGEGSVTLLCGDLTFLHDANGLLAGSGPVPDLRIVVGDDGGGAIFSTLEAGGVAPDVYDTVYRTPHGLDLVAVARAHGAAARTVRMPELATELRRPPSGIEVLVVPVDSRTLPGRAAALAEWAKEKERPRIQCSDAM